MHTAFIATVESQARPRESSEQGAPFLRNRRPYQRTSTAARLLWRGVERGGVRRGVVRRHR